MTVRFRIRTSAGQELSFASDAMFEDFVRAGDLSPDDLVYDAETGSWAPARTHPLVLEIEYENEAEDGAANAEGSEEASADNAFGLTLSDGADEGESEDAAVASDAGESPGPHDDEDIGRGEPADEDLDIDLLPATEVSPEDQARAFVERMHAQRHAAPDYETTDAGSQGIRMESQADISGMVEAVPQAPERAKRAEPRRRVTRPPPERKKSGARMAAAAVVAVLAIVAGYFGTRTLTGDAATDPDAVPPDSVELPVETTPVTPVRTPVIAGNEAAVRDRARERYLAATQTLLRDLAPVPEAWPEGPYLSAPAEHAEVLDVWQSYLSTIRRVRDGDQERYRTAYESALDDAAIEGEARAERLGVAMTDFRTEEPLRAAHFDRVEALASAAIQSHGALLEVDGLIIHDPSGATGAQSGFALGTYGRDADSQFLLDQVVELLEEALAVEALGPGEGVNVRQWVWDGFLDAATR